MCIRDRCSASVVDKVDCDTVFDRLCHCVGIDNRTEDFNRAIYGLSLIHIYDLIIKVFERGAQLVRVRVFAVHYQYGLLTVI